VKKYICEKCFRENGSIHIKDLEKPWHEGLVYCPFCEDYDTYINPTEKILFIDKKIKALNKDKEYYRKLLGVVESLKVIL